jgi:hypothetical protein
VGNQTRVTPEGFKISTRDVTSNVRHVSAEAVAHRDEARGSATLAETKPVDRKNVRRFISGSFHQSTKLTRKESGCVFHHLLRRDLE